MEGNYNIVMALAIYQNVNHYKHRVSRESNPDITSSSQKICHFHLCNHSC